MLQDGKPHQILTCKQQRKFNISGVLLTAFFIAGRSGRHHQLLFGNDVVRSTASISTIQKCRILLLAQLYLCLNSSNNSAVAVSTPICLRKILILLNMRMI